MFKSNLFLLVFIEVNVINKNALFRKSADFFLEIYNNPEATTTSISYKTKTTWSYSSKVVKEMECSGFLTKQLRDQKKYLLLTKKGIKIAESIKKVLEVLNGN